MSCTKITMINVNVSNSYHLHWFHVTIPSKTQVLSPKEQFFPKGDKRGGDLFKDPSLQSGVSSTHFFVDLDQDTQEVIPVKGEQSVSPQNNFIQYNSVLFFSVAWFMHIFFYIKSAWIFGVPLLQCLQLPK